MIYLVAGARPNFMKIAPIVWDFQSRAFHDFRIVHTGQHYDYEMSQTFFMDLDLKRPDHFLESGSGSHAEQTARVLTAFEKICLDERPDLVVVVGDINSTLAASLAAAKLHIPVAHIESGLRSFDKAMPEEINRLLTDHISDHLFASEQSGIDNLRHEGIPEERVHFVGNIMIDSLVRILPRAKKPHPAAGEYILATIHRPSNVDDPASFRQVIELLTHAAQHHPVIMPVHPRTKKSILAFGLEKHFSHTSHVPDSPEQGTIYLIPPTGYVDFVGLMAGARCVITDSGGIQEETTFLMIPCITMRESTERPATVEIGTNTIVGIDREAFTEAVERIRAGTYKKGNRPPLWDGETGKRICDVLLSTYKT